MNKKKIAFLGSSLVSTYWNGAATYYRGILKAMHEQCFDITYYEPDSYERQKYRDIPDPEYAKIVVFEPTEMAVCEVLSKASEADIIIKSSGLGVFDSLLEEEVIRLKSPDKKIVFWDTYPPEILERIESNLNDPFHKCIPEYDIIFTYGGGDPVTNAYAGYGAKNCISIYNALDTSTHFPVETDIKFKADLSLLENRLPQREARVEDFFLKAAIECPEKKFILGGSGWHDIALPSNINYKGHVYTKDHNTFNSSPLAVLNISKEKMARYGSTPSTRVFEAAGAAACIISDRWEGMDSFFEPNKEILVAENGTEVAEILKNLTPEMASQIGKDAYKKAISKHTYSHRGKQLKEILEFESNKTAVV